MMRLAACRPVRDLEIQCIVARIDIRRNNEMIDVAEVVPLGTTDVGAEISELVHPDELSAEITNDDPAAEQDAVAVALLLIGQVAELHIDQRVFAGLEAMAVWNGPVL